MKFKTVILLALVFAIKLSSYSQEIKVNAKQHSLNHVLIDLRDRYSMQFSFDDKLLSTTIITAQRTFSKEEEVIKFLLKNTPFEYQYTDGVFLIYAHNRKQKYYLRGNLYDLETKESLPYSHLAINNIPQVSDMSGGFSFTSEDNGNLHLQASHLGYFVLDTLLKPKHNHKLFLHPAQSNLPEVIVSDRMVQNFIKNGNEVGSVSLNHKIVDFLPGNGDNSVFEILRMQPGIAASNEQTDRVIIWGSYDGETQVLFDKITLWGLKNSFQNIGDINPLMAKYINVEKGGYDSQYDGRVGGFVNIIGKNGNKIKPAFNLMLSNVTANASLELPLSKKSSLITAYRQTYYNLYEKESVTTSVTNSNNGTQNVSNIVLVPNYKFRDMNLKYSYSGDEGDSFNVSLLHGANAYDYDFYTGKSSQIRKNESEDTKQYGASVIYNKHWSRGGQSEFFASSSGLSSSYTNLVNLYRLRNNNTEVRRRDERDAEINEYNLGFNHEFRLSKKIIVKGGLTYLYNKIKYSEDTLGVNLMNYESDMGRLSGFVQNNISLNKNLSAKIGINLNYPTLVEKVYADPRLSLSYKISPVLSVNSGWGIYRQFISRSIIWDDENNKRNFWVGSDEEIIPVLNSQHLVFGATLHNDDFTMSFEAYHKFTKGHTRYFRNRITEGITIGKSRTYGLDLFVKKTLNKHAFWIAYTLGRTEEKFEYGQIKTFRRAIHDQTHELKVAGLVNVGRFYCSTNYMWGSGFPTYNSLHDEIVSEPNYSRLDASIIYKMKPKKIKAEFGLMFLNVFDEENINYFDSELLRIGQTEVLNINEKTTPFSVRFFFKIGF